MPVFLSESEDKPLNFSDRVIIFATASYATITYLNHYLMSIRKIKLGLVFLGMLMMVFVRTSSAQNLQLYTTFPKISVAAGEVVDYNVKLINNSSGTLTTDLAVHNLPEGWSHRLTSGTYTVERISILPKERKTLNLKVFIPGNQTKGSNTFYLDARGHNRLPLTIQISEEGSGHGDFSSSQTNMEGAANSTFTYNATLFNRSTDNQVFALSAHPQAGWAVLFKADGKQVSSVNVDGNQRKDILIEVLAPEGTKKGTYKIPVRATGTHGQSEITFEVVVTGSYKLDLSTVNGVLNANIGAGSTETIQLTLKNSGSSDINQINLSAETPSNWEVIFEPSRINLLKAGETTNVNAKVRPASKAIAGDYMLTMNARSSDANSQAQFRISVETSLLRGWVGILLIAAALGIVYALIRKYGRR